MTFKKRTVFAAALLLGFSTQSMAAADWGFQPLPFKAPVPENNPMSAAKVMLGKQLFFDPRLSKNDMISCNFCHDVAGNGTDSRSTSVGVDGQLGGRSAPSVWNAAFLSSQFWDGRAPNLEEQAKGPILNPIEMGITHEASAVDRIASIPGYKKQFAAIFGGDEPVTYNNIAKAIASYERTLITPNSLFDQYLRGDKTAMNEKQLAGMKEFEDLGCIRCHNGPAFAGPLLPKGEVFYQYFPANRSAYDQLLGLQEDEGHRNDGGEKTPSLWRVPSLRNIAMTAPYFHNGSVETLNKAVRVMAKVQLNRDITDDQADKLEAFLETLTGDFTVQRPPVLPED